MRIYQLALLLAPFLLAFVSPAPLAGSQNGSQPSQAASPAQDVPEAQRSELQESIRHLLVSQVDGWNHGKLEEFMQGYWQSPDLTFFSGATVTKGWEPTLLRYRQRYQAGGKEMGKLEFQDLTINLLSSRGAVVTGKWQLTMSDGKQPHGLFTLIIKKMPEGWRIVHDHTSAAE